MAQGADEQAPVLRIQGKQRPKINKGKVLFSTLNYHDRPIFNPELQNQTSCTLQLSKPCKIHPKTKSTLVFSHVTRPRGANGHVSYPLLSLSLTDRWATTSPLSSVFLLAPPALPAHALAGAAPRTPSRRCRSSHPRRRRQAPPSLSSPPCGAMAGPHPPLLPAQAAELARVPAAGRGGAGSPARVPAAARRSARRGGAGSTVRARETAGRGGQIRPAAASLPRGGARRAPPW